MSVDKLLQKALDHQLSGDLRSAEIIYGDILEEEPANLDALNRLGIVCLDTGRIDDAIGHFRKALEIKPDFHKAQTNLGNGFILQGRFADAAQLFEKVLIADSSNSAAIHGLGTCFLQLGDLNAAMQYLQRAALIDPDSTDTLNNIGLIHLKRGEYDLAAEHFEKSIAINPDNAKAHTNLGTTFKARRDYRQATGCFQRALKIDPNHLDAINNLGLVSYEQMGREALMGAIAHYRKALQINPDYFPSLYNLGIALHDCGELDEAADCYRKCLSLSPYDHGALGMALVVHARSCNWEAVNQVLGTIRDRFVQDANFSVIPFPLLAASDSAAFHFEAARRHVRGSIVAIKKHTAIRQKVASDKIRVAYLSHDFRQHATSILMAELFELHDRDRFEIVGVSYGPDDESAMRQRVSSAFDRFIDVRDRSDPEVAALLATLEVDIAVDLKGHTQYGRPAILASRPCPVQVSYLGYPGTMGADFIDYILGDKVVTPMEHQIHYSEKIVQLRNCYQINDSKRAISPHTPGRIECGLPEHGFVFCCFNNSYKITAEAFDVWMRLLGRIEGSVLWLLDDNRNARANLTREAAARGIDPGRLVFAQRTLPEHHLARHCLADLFLDTFPYNAHTTASDALWTGLPIVSCMGESFASRVCASLLHAVGLPNLVTVTVSEYENLALALARDRALLGRIRKQLEEQRQACALFDASRFCKDIELAYETMWEIYQNGGSPKSFAN